MASQHRAKLGALFVLLAAVVGCRGTAASPPPPQDRPAAQAEASRASPAPAAAAVTQPKPPRRLGGQPVVLWEQPAPFATGLAAGGERVFVFSGNDIYAVDSKGGGLAWSYLAPEVRPAARLLGCACAAGGTLVGDRLYTVSGGDTVTALDPASGAVHWTRRVGDAVATPPLSAGNILVVVAADPGGFFLAGIDPNSGVRLWETRPDLPIFPALAAHGRVVMAPLAAGGAAGFNADTGEPLWSSVQPAAKDLFKPSQVGAGLVALKTEDGVLALDPTTGGVRWRQKLGGWPSILSVFGEQVYADTRSSQLLALDARSGQIRWTADLAPGFYSDGLLAADKGLYVLVREGRLVALDPGTGEARWEQRIPATMGGPALVGGALALGALEGRVHVLDPDSGRLLGTAAVPGSVVLAPLDDSERFFLLAEDLTGATLVAFGWQDAPDLR